MHVGAFAGVAGQIRRIVAVQLKMPVGIEIRAAKRVINPTTPAHPFGFELKDCAKESTFRVFALNREFANGRSTFPGNRRFCPSIKSLDLSIAEEVTY